MARNMVSDLLLANLGYILRMGRPVHETTYTASVQWTVIDRARPTPRILSTGPADIRWTMWRRRRRTIHQNCQTTTSCPTHTTPTTIHRITEL